VYFPSVRARDNLPAKAFGRAPPLKLGRKRLKAGRQAHVGAAVSVIADQPHSDATIAKHYFLTIKKNQRDPFF